MAKSWKDLIFLDGMGSFRGIKFYVESTDSDFGRRTILHEFPGSEHIEVEDLGRGTQKFTFNAYIISNIGDIEDKVPNYIEWKNQFIEAIERPGSGPLVHPYLGDMTAAIDGMVRISETTQEGGMCRFTINAIRTKDLPPVTKDTAKEVDELADEATVAAGEDFEDDWTIADVVEFIRDAAEEITAGVNSVTSKINKVKGMVQAVMNTVDAIGDAITQLSDAVTAIILLPGQLVSSITNLVSDVFQAIDNIGDAFDSYFSDSEIAGDVAGTPSTSPFASTPASGEQRANLLLKSFNEFMTFGDDMLSVNETTPSRIIQAKNQSTMINFLKTIATIETCRVAATLPFASYNQAIELRDALSDQLDDLALTANDKTYVALMNLRAAITKYLTNASSDLPKVVSYSTARTLPALVVAHNLYGDSTKEADLIYRNNISNPGFVGGGVELEVLSNE